MTHKKRFFGFIHGVLAWSMVVGTAMAANEADFFDQKDKTFWVLKDAKAFRKGADIFVDDDGNWKGTPPAPQYIKYAQPLEKSDLPYLEKWLSLKSLDCFSVTDIREHPNLRLINAWRNDLEEKGEDLEKKNLYKLAWLNYQSMLHELYRGEYSVLPSQWVETNRAFQMKNSHYLDFKKLIAQDKGVSSH